MLLSSIKKKSKDWLPESFQKTILILYRFNQIEGFSSYEFVTKGVFPYFLLLEQTGDLKKIKAQLLCQAIFKIRSEETGTLPLAFSNDI